MVIPRLERARTITVRGALGLVLAVAAVVGATGGAAFAAGPSAPPAPPLAGQVPAQYWLADAAGTVWAFGGAGNFGGTPGGALSSPVVAVAATPSGNGYWLLASDGSVWAEGGARAYGPGGDSLDQPAVDMAPTADGLGYWLVSAGGSVYSFGDAHYFGSLTSPVDRPIVRLVPTPDGAGYWLLSADGGLFGFGDARLFGPGASPSSPTSGSPIVDMAPTPDGFGYWLVSADGSVYSFGDATNAGSATVPAGGDPAEKIVPDASGHGYWVVDQNGTATPFGDAEGRPPAQALLFSPVTPGDRAVLFALSQLGKPYVWGGTGPRGYDCSGLAYRSWYEATGTYIPRVANAQYHGAGPAVAWAGLQAGDLVFWGTDAANWQSVYHTAIYVGGAQIVEATGNAVQLNTLNQWRLPDLMGHGVRPSP
ncbi:MAG: C40 family peptidase [Acidimicrobiales bacterium]